MKNVFIFPGQGVQNAQMLTKLNAYGVNVSDIFDEISEVCGFDVAELIRTGTPEILSQTQYTQIIMYAMDIAYLEILKAHGIKPDIVAGHSLGQYAALTAAGVITFREASALIRERSRLMNEIEEKGALCAITSNHMENEFISNICNEIQDSHKGCLSIALYNSNKQTVVGGHKECIEAFQAHMNQFPEYKTKLLAVGQAFHTNVMDSMLDEFAEYVSKLDIHPATSDIILNCTGEYYKEDLTGEILRKEMIEQCHKPVQWLKIMEQIVNLKDVNIIEVGPGNVSGKLFKNYTKEVKVFRSDDRKDFNNFLKQYELRKEKA